MKTAIIVISEASISMAKTLKQELPESEIFSTIANADCRHIPALQEAVPQLFRDSDALIFIGAMGICVRSIAPYVKSKYTDPAVVCLDSTGKYVVSVLSGHIGGANELTHELARLLNAEAIVTTQSDNLGLWPLDTLAQPYGWEQDVYTLQDDIHSFSDTNFAKTDEEVFAASRKKAMNECVTRFVNRKSTALLLDIRTKETDYMEETCPPHVDIFYKYEDIDWKNTNC